MHFHFIDLKQNPADILTKPLDHTSAWPFIDTLLFRKGETMPQEEVAGHGTRGVSDGRSVPAQPVHSNGHISPNSGPFVPPFGPVSTHNS